MLMRRHYLPATAPHPASAATSLTIGPALNRAVEAYAAKMGAVPDQALATLLTWVLATLAPETLRSVAKSLPDFLPPAGAAGGPTRPESR